MPIIDHITLVVSDYARSRTFYEKALAPLGIKAVREFGRSVRIRSRTETRSLDRQRPDVVSEQRAGCA